MSPWTILAGLLLLGSAFAGGYYEGHHQEAQVLAAKLATVQAQDATALAAAEAAARAQEQASAQHLAVIEQTYLEQQAHAKQVADAALASLRAGTLRLRAEWSCTPALAAHVSAAASGGPAADAAAQLRFEGASDLVHAGDDADAQIAALQAIVRADRQVLTPPIPASANR
jgi:hypothetical protein